MVENASEGDGKPDSATGDRKEYELDMDKHSSGDIEAAIRDAVEAVDREASGEFEVVEVVDEETSESSTEAQLKERLVRTLADFDNYRKRAEREKKTLRRMGTFDVLKDSLGVIDNLERALGAGGDIEDLKQGLQLILRQYEEFLRRHGAQRIEAEGQGFDPTLHEAVAREESSDVDEPTVTRELQTGYLFHDRLLRPSMVHVAMPAAPPPDDGADGDEPEEALD